MAVWDSEDPNDKTRAYDVVKEYDMADVIPC